MTPTEDMVRVAQRAYTDALIEGGLPMRAALTAALAAMWQPIETAPRDGTPFLCFHPDDVFSPQTGIDLIWFEPSIKTYTMDGDNEVPFAGITHWVPLPVAPLDSGLSTDTSSSRSPSLHREPLLNNSSDTTLSTEGMREAVQPSIATRPATSGTAASGTELGGEQQHINRTLRAMEHLRMASYEAESLREERRMMREYNAMLQSIKPLLDKRDGVAPRIAISGKSDSEEV